MSEDPRVRKLESARDTITKVLQAMDIGCVVAVDDEWAPQNPGLIIAAEPARFISGQKLNREAEYGPWIEKIWADIDDDELIRLRAKAARKRPDLVGDALEILAYLCSGHGSFQALRPEAWEAKQVEIVEKYGPEHVLVLFDRFIGGAPEVGEGMLGDFLTAHPTAHAAMISSKTSREEELERQAMVATAIGVTTEKVLLASKDHLTADDCGQFADFLRHAANAPHLRAIRDAVVKLAQDGQKTAVVKIEDMSLRVLEDIVMRSSRTEGAYEVDTMLRAVNIEVNAAVRAELVPEKSVDLRAGIRAARQLAEASFLDDKDSHDKAEELLAQERFETGETVNAGGLPVANGDVFEINGKAFVLFEPPCDMVMRDTVSSSRDHKHAKLVALEAPGRQRVWPLPRYAPFEFGDDLVADFGETLHLPLRILDLCSFNADGSARIDLGAEGPEVEPLTPGLLRRYEQLTKMATGLLELAEQVAEQEAVRARLLLVDDLQGEADGRGIRWPVRRLGRLARPVAAAGLAAESADASRPANLHDLGVFESRLGKDGQEGKICGTCGQTTEEEEQDEETTAAAPGEADADAVAVKQPVAESAEAEGGPTGPASGSVEASEADQAED